ncbi:NAD(P)-binding protein [Fragilariopsis cylindrus CCMP1102]|uniref:NAD(P)-binding protein n=1 Tax=Fragilariopsis cylindrus CCMP1102 TaxID=635003 RepID=A0A1E7FL98_9STRA|nr:NAD(P)-binding protein [Fragilariopsis cylindrus CCMP1102]|eukprot:OEU18907.1 NAD(P)-binding protein [Fragilariopsis cylindrus CCMP1102]
MGLFLSRYEKFVKELPDVTGKVFVITGTTSGTGFIAAETVAKQGGEVLLLNRASSRSVESLERLKASVPDGKFVPIECDLQDFESVRKAVKEIKETYKSIYCLSNNAGIMAVDDTITKTDGFEVQMQTNHLSHFLLTKELFPLILAGSKEYGDARIVQHSSAGRHMTPNDGLEEKYFLKQEKDGLLGGNEDTGMMKGGKFERYFQTKLANSVFTQCLHDKLVAAGENNEECKNVLSVCAHPGGSKTSLGEHLKMGFFIDTIFSLLLQSPADGAMGLLKGMMGTKESVKCGTLYGPKMLAGYAVPNPSKPYEIDPEAKDMLWRTSETATGGKFDII